MLQIKQLEVAHNGPELAFQEKTLISATAKAG